MDFTNGRYILQLKIKHSLLSAMHSQCSRMSQILLVDEFVVVRGSSKASVSCEQKHLFEKPSSALLFEGNLSF